MHLGNKLKKAAIYFTQQNMKVNLAVQLLRKSVSDALDFCREVLKNPEFWNSKPTSKFIRVFNDAFDVLNSRKYTQFGLNKALCAENIVDVQRFVAYAVDYILNLKTIDFKRRKTGFLGIIGALKNIQTLHDVWISTGLLKYI